MGTDRTVCLHHQREQHRLPLRPAWSPTQGLAHGRPVAAVVVQGPMTHNKSAAGPILILIILLAAGLTLFLVWYIPERRRSFKAANEGKVFRELKALASDEADFRFHDRD